MKDRLSRGLELAVQSVNYVLITYALSNLAMLMRRNWLYILFFALEIWLTQQYWTKARELTGSKILSGLLLILCLAVQGAMLWWVGRVVGTVVPFAAEA